MDSPSARDLTGATARRRTARREYLRSVASHGLQLAEIEQQLAPIHAAGHLDVEWIGVNGPRVDVLVRTQEDEWRLVFGTADGERVDWLHVYRRPPVFDGVDGGRAVVINGPSGAGKSTLLNALRVQSPDPWVVFDEPICGVVDQGYLIWRDRAPVLHRGFVDAIAALARAGNHVATSAAGLGQQIFDEAFAGIPLLRIGLDCDLATLLLREQGREGRWGGIAAASIDDHRGWDYHARFDTTQLTAAKIATKVLALIADADATELGPASA